MEVPLILGQPFLPTSKALIDVKDGHKAFRVGEDKVVFKLHRTMRHSSSEDDTCFSVDVTNEVISECVKKILEEDPIDALLEKLMIWIRFWR